MKNQIDYQTVQGKINNSFSSQTINIPLPINSILKGFTIDSDENLSASANYMFCQVSLIQASSNSNIRINQRLAEGNIGYFGDSSNIAYNSVVYLNCDIPIQKEGIILEVRINNYTGGNNIVNVTYLVKNLEGGI